MNRTLHFLFALALVICAAIPALAKEPATILSGTITIEKPMVFEGTTVTIRPGTTIIVTTPLQYAIHIKKGTLIMEGTPDEPIIIKGKKTDDELEDVNAVFLEGSTGSIAHVRFSECSWGLHMHNSKADIHGCVFEKGHGGMRFLGGSVSVKNCVFTHNGIAVRFLNGSPSLTNNIFSRNATAIFIREGVSKTDIEQNAFMNNDTDLYAGFFQTQDIRAGNNFFTGKPSVFDNTKDSGIKARIVTDPVLSTFPDWH